MLNNVQCLGWLLRKLKGIKLSLLMLLAVGYTSVKVIIIMLLFRLNWFSEFSYYQLDAVRIPNRVNVTRVNEIYLRDCTRIFPTRSKLLLYVMGITVLLKTFSVVLYIKSSTVLNGGNAQWLRT